MEGGFWREPGCLGHFRERKALAGFAQRRERGCEENVGAPEALG